MAGAGKRRPLSIGAPPAEWYAVGMSTDAKDTETRSSLDDIIDLYKKDIDRTLIRETLKLSVEERLVRMMNFMRDLEELRQGKS